MAFTLTFNPEILRSRRNDALMLARTYRGLGMPRPYIQDAARTARIWNRALVHQLLTARGVA